MYRRQEYYTDSAVRQENFLLKGRMDEETKHPLSIWTECSCQNVWRNGCGGRFFACLKNMYNNSKSWIKLIQRLSKTIDVTIGTVQGHSLSPLRMFDHDLSTKLAELDNISLPNLHGFSASQLPCVDDLFLLALNNHSLQAQLDCLDQFNSKWELSIYIQKTNVMVFISSARLHGNFRSS